ncbi:MAG: outer membrane lipoprotein-sorting protein, partial [Firmicutes bacterium]|nr:outer membrane lipoprotein-sorting protein [Bacillota bacterium]
MKKTRIFILSLSLLAAVAAVGLGFSAAEILRAVERNEEFTTLYYEARMEIQVGGRRVTKTMRGCAQGNEKGLVEFTNPRDLGTRILKIGDDLWLYSPTAEEEVRLSGDMLRQGMMGSDISYQDALEYEHLT